MNVDSSPQVGGAIVEPGPRTPSAIARGPKLVPYEHATLTSLFFGAVERYSARPALGRAPRPERLTYAQALGRVERLIGLMVARGIGRGDRVAILSENRPEWVLTDYACLCLGAVTVPIYPNLPVAQVGEILRDSGSSLVFASTAGQAARVREADDNLTPCVFDDLDTDLLGAPDPRADWRARALEVAPDDLATIIYTSGTTGTPKGVMLTHRNLAAIVAATAQHGSISVEPGEIVLSILPLSHALERAASFYFWANGATVVYAESLQTVARDIAAVAPHYLVVVPRVLEKIHGTLTGGAGIAGAIARWAARVSIPIAIARTTGRGMPPWLRLQAPLADRFVFSALRRKLGGRVRALISGGAPLAPDVASLFIAADIPVFEGYGLTETAPVLTANRPGGLRLGSVGLPYPGVELRIGEDHEIHARGPTIMKGYWRRPVDTEQAFTADGWFRTGDIGHIDEDGFLYITDRLKDLIVTAGGKNIAPQPIEQAVRASPHIAQAILIGDRRPYPVMLIVPDFPVLQRWAVTTGKHAPGLVADHAALVRAPDVRALLEGEVAQQVAQFPRVEQPKRVAIVPDEFTIEDGILTPTQKVRRRVVAQRYADLLSGLYAARRESRSG